MIIKKYEHLRTPEHIMNSIELATKQDAQDFNSLNFHQYDAWMRKKNSFLKESIKNRQEKGIKSNVIPFQCYSPTFESLDKYRKQFYFYWRSQASEGHFIDTELSYIFLFAYELINYGFNSGAAYNVSLLVQLYENYIYRYPKLRDYLPQWIADLLLELGETELALEWLPNNDKDDTDYVSLKTQENHLSAINMNTWWKFIPQRNRSHFFMDNKQKIYTNYKEMVEDLNIVFMKESNGTAGIIERLYPVKLVQIEREMFPTAVLCRQVGAENITVYKRILDNDFCLILAEIMHIAENMVREEKAQPLVKINNGIIPTGLERRLIEHREKRAKMKRFMKVSNDKIGDTGSEIPKEQEDIDFDFDYIDSLTKESEELKVIFEEKFKEVEEDDSEKIMKDQLPPTTTIFEKSIQDIFSSPSADGDELRNLFDTLTPLEIKFLRMLKEELSIEEAKSFLKRQGIMFGSFLIELNEKSEEHLGEAILEENGDFIEIAEEYISILHYE